MVSCPECGAKEKHPFLQIEGGAPAALIYTNKKPGKHQCLVCSGYFHPETLKRTPNNYIEENGWFHFEEQQRED